MWLTTGVNLFQNTFKKKTGTLIVIIFHNITDLPYFNQINPALENTTYFFFFKNNKKPHQPQTYER